MKTKFILIIGLLGAILSFSSCNKEETEIAEIIENDYPNFKDIYNNTIFQHGGGWDEVEYLVSDPSKYEIHRYYVIARGYTIDDLTTRCIYCYTIYPIFTDVYCDSVFIGQFEFNTNYQVYFKDVNSGDSVLLYDFEPILTKNLGNYFHNTSQRDFVPPTYSVSETGYRDINVGSKIWRWDYDEFGGRTIVSIGSTAGVFSPIIGNPKPGYAREVLQCYRKSFYEVNYLSLVERYGDLFRDQAIKIGNTYYEGDPIYYYNPDTPVAPYLPDDLWVQPWVIDKYKEYKDSQN